MTTARASTARLAMIGVVTVACCALYVGRTEGEPRMSPPHAVVETRVSLRREHVVRVTGDAPYFSPPTLVVRAGDVVRWQSEPVAELHNVHELRDASFVAMIPPGQAFTYRFSRPGELDYGCRIHPWMRGHVSVLPYRVVEQPLDPGTGGVALVRIGERVAALAGPEPRLVLLPEGRVTPLDVDVHRTIAGDAQARAWFVTAKQDGLIGVGVDGGKLPRALQIDAGSITAAAVAPGGRVWLLRAGDGRVGWNDPGSSEVHWSASAAPASPVVALAATEHRVFRMTKDGRLWSTAMDGADKEWPLPTGTRITRIAADGDRLWTVDSGRAKLLRIDGDRVIERSLPPTMVAPSRLAVSPDHALFFIAGQREDRLARLTEDGQMDEFELDNTASPPTALAIESAKRGWLIRAGRIAWFEIPDLAPLADPDGSRGRIPGETRPNH
jgi:plastocyanin